MERAFTTPYTGKCTWEQIFAATRAVGARAHGLVDRPRAGLQPAGRGRAGHHGRPLPRGRLQRRGGPDHGGRRTRAGSRRPTLARERWRRHEPAHPGHRRALGRLRLARRRRDRQGGRRRAARPRSSRSPTASAASPASCGRRRARRSRTSSASATPRPRRPPGARRAVPLPGPRRLPAADRRRRAAEIADAIREFAPDVLITHTDTDPFNPDHPVAYAAVDRARGLAAGAGVLERVRHDPAAGAVPVRAPPARAVQLHADDVRRHHLGVRAEARGDGRDEGPAVPADLLRPARRAARQPRAARVRATRRSATPRRSSASSRRWWSEL